MSDERHEEAGGPVPVRDLMKVMRSQGDGAAGAEGEPRWDGQEQGFEMDGEEWWARSAGAGAYGTGRSGLARLVAVHFYRAADPSVPVREALIPAGAFRGMSAEELRVAFERATPIEQER